MYEALVYFDGPLSRWSGKPDEREIIWRCERRVRAFAIGAARARARSLTGCGWIVLRDGVVVAGELPTPTVVPGAAAAP
ncbi:MAG TPA: hypothetical protein VGF89_00925 [Steroidobacteraceae bacterium]|jgi:hypothetical protein